MTKSEKLSYYAVVFLALIAVLVSAWQASLSRELNRLSLRPFLDTFTGWSDKKNWSIEPSNNGIGPAVITTVSYQFDGKTYIHWDDVLEAAGIRLKRTPSHNFGSRSYLPSGERLNYLVIEKQEQDKPFGILARIEYESIYEE